MRTIPVGEGTLYHPNPPRYIPSTQRKTNHTNNFDMRTLFLCLILLVYMIPAVAQTQALQEANNLFQAQQWVEAVEAYTAIVEEDASQGLAWYRLGLAQMSLNQPEKAIESLATLDATGNANPVVKAQLAKAHAMTGKTKEVLDLLLEAGTAGYAGTSFIQTDPAFTAIRTHARFDEVVAAIDRNARPCLYMEEHRQFDFWVGTWNVFTAQGVQVGTNTIERPALECMLVEKWTSSTGGQGTSINFYHPVKEQWVQHWVAAGYMIEIAGGLVDGAMVMEGTLIPVTGAATPFRGSWTPLPDGRVRQFFEQSTDGGETWAPWFDGYYERQDTATP